MMWFLVLLLLSYPNPVESQGTSGQKAHRLKLKGGSNPCEGYIQVYNEGKWGYVGAESLSDNDKKVVCRSIECGEPESSVGMLLPHNSVLWLHELRCSGSEKYLWDCAFSQWNASTYRGQTVEKITCSKTIKLSLEGFSCEGKVQYFNDGKKEQGYICGDNWGKKEANVLCKSLGCDNAKQWTYNNQNKQNGRMIATNCLGTEDNLWECAPEQKPCSKPARVSCEAHERVRVKGSSSNVCSGTLEIKKGENWVSDRTRYNKTTLDRWCRHMYCGSYKTHAPTENGTDLTCSEKVRVVLLNNQKPSHCYGTVHWDLNGTHSPVCGTGWKTDNFAVVCRELGCGKVIYTAEKSTDFRSKMNDITCAKDDLSLWHCEGTHSDQPVSCRKQVYVVCSESTHVMLKDGPGRCAGRLEIFYEGQLQKLRKNGWSNANSNTVCEHLGCGKSVSNPSSSAIFSKGPNKFWDKKIFCKANHKTLFDCEIKNDNNPTSDDKTVNIWCDGYRDLFLSDDFCRGEVRIQVGGVANMPLHLRGSEDSWNKASADAVCAQRRCGTAQEFNVTKVNTPESPVVWNIFDCPSHFRSLFDCNNGPEVNISNPIEVASVTCTGNNTIALTQACWGYVDICENGQCGGMCAEVWTNDHSKKLCQRLGCGENIVPVEKKDKNFKVDFKSLHLLDSADLAKSHIVKREENDTSCSGNPAYIICIGSYRPRFVQSKDYCSGNVELYQENDWLPLCKNALKDKSTLNVMCKQLNCGRAGQSIDYYGASEKKGYVSTLECPANSESLKSCTSSSITTSCPPSGLRCSDWKQMMLLYGENACSGVVFVYSSERNRDAVSAVGWTDNETQRLCEDLNCGNKGDFEVKEMIANVPFWNGSFNCTSVKDPQNIWDCKKDKVPKKKKQLFIKCFESPTVNLTQQCHGEVMINDLEVCDTLWKSSDSDLVCKEMKCSGAVDGILNTVPPQSRSKEYHHVSCESYHTKLGQCRRFKAPCKGKLVTVYCRENIKYNTTENCGGDIEVSFQNGTWDKVCLDKDLPFSLKENLCKDCGGVNSKRNNNKNEETVLNASLACTNDHQNIRYCAFKQTCKGKPAQLFCKDYKDPPEKTPPSPAVPILLGILLILIVTTAVVLFLRFYLIRNKKTIKDFLPKFSKQKEEDFESGEYEDVPSKDGSSHDTNAVGENNASTSSLGYDDVDELVETRPLTSEDPQQAEDGDYEVDDPHDSYDDIGATVDVVEIAAEVHPTPKGMEDVPGEDPDLLVLGEDDYLVPGQEA